jgi:hypothetical protein
MVNPAWPHPCGAHTRVRDCCSQVLALDRPLDLLVNNAGRFLDAPFQLTEDGFEQVWGGRGGRPGRRLGMWLKGWHCGGLATGSAVHWQRCREAEGVQQPCC